MSLAVAAVALFLVRLGIFTAIHLRHRDTNPVTGTVSDLGVGAARTAFTVMGAVTAAGYALVAVALWTDGYRPGWQPLVLAVAAAATLAILWFPTDLTGSGTRTATGTVHLALAIAGFALLFVFASNAELAHVPGWLATTLTVLLWAVRISFYAFLGTLIVPALRARLVGLTERAFLVFLPLWFTAFGVALAVRATAG